MTQPTVTPYKQLRRPYDDRIVAGVCSGVGRYFGVDPVLVRVVFAIIAVLTWGVSLLAYPVMWFLMPEEPRPPAPAYPDPMQYTGGFPGFPGFPYADPAASTASAAPGAPAAAPAAEPAPAPATVAEPTPSAVAEPTPETVRKADVAEAGAEQAKP